MTVFWRDCFFLVRCADGSVQKHLPKFKGDELLETADTNHIRSIANYQLPFNAILKAECVGVFVDDAHVFIVKNRRAKNLYWTTLAGSGLEDEMRRACREAKEAMDAAP